MVNNLSLKDSIKAFLSRARATLPGRWLWFLSALGLIINGLYIIHQREPLGEINPDLDFWNATFRLELVNIQNLGAGLPYLLGGAALSALAFLPIWNTEHESSKTPDHKQAKIWSYLLPRLFFSLLLFAFLVYKLGQHEYTPVLPWLWVFILGWMTFLLYKQEKATGTTLSMQVTRSDVLWMLGLFLAGLAIGSFALQDIPNIMVPDEGSFWETGRAIASGEFKPPFFDFGVYTFPVASSILQGWVMRLVGVNLWGWRFSSVLAGTLTVIPLYLLTREWFDRRVAILATLIMVSSPYYLSFARMGYNNSQALFPAVFSLYFWSLGFKRHSLFYYWLAGLAAGLGFYTYPSAWLGLVTIGIVTGLLTLLRRISFRQVLLAMGIFLTAVTVTAGPRFVYGASSPNAEPLFFKLLETSFISSFYGSAYYGYFDLYPKGVAYLIGKNQIFYAPEVYFELLTRSTVRTLAALFDPFIVTEHFMTTNFAGGFILSIGFALGLSLCLRTIKQTRSLLLLTWLGAGLFFLSIIAAFPPRHTHLVTVIPVLAMLSAIGFAFTIETLLSGLKTKWTEVTLSRISTGILVLVGVVMVFSGVREYFAIMPTRNPPLFEDVASWIAWRTEEPLNIIYVGSTDIPHRIQYQINTRMAPHNYIGIKPENFHWEGVPANSIVFFEQQATGIPAPLPRFNNSATYTNNYGETIGYAWANTNVNLKPQPPFPITMGEIPVTIIPALSALVIIVVILVTLQFHISTEKMTDKTGLRLHVEVILRNKKSKERDKLT